MPARGRPQTVRPRIEAFATQKERAGKRHAFPLVLVSGDGGAAKAPADPDQRE